MAVGCVRAAARVGAQVSDSSSPGAARARRSETGPLAPSASHGYRTRLAAAAVRRLDAREREQLRARRCWRARRRGRLRRCCRRASGALGAARWPAARPPAGASAAPGRRRAARVRRDRLRRERRQLHGRHGRVHEGAGGGARGRRRHGQRAAGPVRARGQADDPAGRQPHGQLPRRALPRHPRPPTHHRRHGPHPDRRAGLHRLPAGPGELRPEPRLRGRACRRPRPCSGLCPALPQLR